MTSITALSVPHPPMYDHSTAFIAGTILHGICTALLLMAFNPILAIPLSTMILVTLEIICAYREHRKRLHNALF
ncbi:MAG: hypothetical protein [Siphoviridae sp. ctpQM7]|nr:MAG: hypothetical protein [Siphoviridae sp. ctpQM7]